MGFEVFTRNVVKTGSPMVSVTTMGRMAFNKAAAVTFQKTATEYVLILWDGATRRVGIRPIGKKEQRAYHLSPGGKRGEGGSGAGYSCVTFLNHINYDWSKTRQFTLEWNDQDNMFIFSIPKEYLLGRPSGEQLALPTKIRRADRAKAAMAKTNGIKEAAVPMTQ